MVMNNETHEEQQQKKKKKKKKKMTYLQGLKGRYLQKRQLLSSYIQKLRINCDEPHDSGV